MNLSDVYYVMWDQLSRVDDKYRVNGSLVFNPKAHKTISVYLSWLDGNGDHQARIVPFKFGGPSWEVPDNQPEWTVRGALKHALKESGLYPESETK